MGINRLKEYYRKKYHILIPMLILLVYLISSCALATTDDPYTTQTPESGSADSSNISYVDTPDEISNQTGEETTFSFTDSAGREVMLPKQISRVVPSGPIAQVVLYTAVPDLLVGLAVTFTTEAGNYIPEEIYNLPVFGQFFGRNAGINMEALMAAKPDLVIDMGENRSQIAEDLDQLQEQIGIPVIFLESTWDNLGTSDNIYAMLAELFPSQLERLDRLSQQAQEIYNSTINRVAEIPESERLTIYYATGDAGLNTIAAGILHSRIFETLGLTNVVEGVEISNQVGGTVVSMEQLLLWDPDFIVVETQSAYEIITTDATWASMSAVSNHRVFLIPSVPYNFLGSPPSVNQLLGLMWLGNLVYPDVIQWDLHQMVSEFYMLFYQIELTPDQISEILLTN